MLQQANDMGNTPIFMIYFYLTNKIILFSNIRVNST